VIDGGAGTNTLNYSLYTSGVYANLQSLSATGTAGIANVQNVTGSAVGGDILVGDGNNNVLTENAGDNLVIGGGGADTLTGGSGSDILIAGSTIYDRNVAALEALLATWDNPSLSFALRVASLQSGVSYTDGSGTHLAALAAHSTVSQPTGSGPSTLKGGSGLDWFFAAVTDVITNKKTGEIVSTL
jgi:Ca2+-binding RTX toxin-like protein